MAIARTYSCDLCRDTHDAHRLIGLYWQDHPKKGWIEKPAREVEKHICFKCLSSIQAIEARCGGGFKCNGGPNCGSDHK